MMDTMGQAQAMTGGYGNSYAQGVGQQAYQGYLQGLNEQVPNLYQMALNRYIQQGDQMLDQYSMITSQEAQDYSRWQDQQNLALQQAQAMIAQGVRPSDELLAQTGLSKEYLDAMLPENAGGSSGGWDPLQDAIDEYWRNNGKTYTFEEVLEHARQMRAQGRTGEQIRELLSTSGLSEDQQSGILRTIR